MTNICFINGSPKASSKSNSAVFIERFCKYLNSSINITKFFASKILNDSEALSQIIKCNKIIFVSPLYADTLPSHMLEFLTILEKYIHDNNCSDIEVYGIVNCGFYEGNQCKYALNMFKFFSKRANLNWKYGLAIGGGEGLANMPEDSIHSESLRNAFKILSNSINNNDDTQKENIFLIPDKMTGFIYRLVANYGWCVTAKKQFNINFFKLLKKVY